MSDQTAPQRHHFVFVKLCGCPIGPVEGSYAKTEDGAGEIFCDGRHDRRELCVEGIRIHYVSHARATTVTARAKPEAS